MYICTLNINDKKQHILFSFNKISLSTTIGSSHLETLKEFKTNYAQWVILNQK